MYTNNKTYYKSNLGMTNKFSLSPIQPVSVHLRTDRDLPFGGLSIPQQNKTGK